MTRHPVTLVVCLPRVVPDDPNRANPELGAGCGGEGAAVGLARGATCQSMWQLDVELREEVATRRRGGAKRSARREVRVARSARPGARCELREALGQARGTSCQSLWQLDVELREELATRESRARPGTPNRTGRPARPTRAGRPPRGEPPRRRARRKR